MKSREGEHRTSGGRVGRGEMEGWGGRFVQEGSWDEGV